jgi:hypothetical protein
MNLPVNIAPLNSQNVGQNVIQIGQDFFEIDIWLYNFLDKHNLFQVPYFFVRQLVLQEVLMEWNISGYITLESQYEILERGAAGYKTFEQVKAPFLLRTDGRNRLFIRIKPYIKGKTLSEELSPEWEIMYNCVVYDIQDSTEEDPTLKMRTLYFKDEKHQILQERNVEWSTGLGRPANQPDIQRSQNPNEAVKDFLKAVSKTGNGDTSLKVGFDSAGSIANPNIEFERIDEANWDKGTSEEDYKIFYTSQGNSNALDDLNYLLNHTKSTDGFPVLLGQPRNSLNPGWKLYSMSSFFKDSKNHQIEKLIIQDGVDDDGSTPHISRAFDGNSSSTQNFVSGIASKIKNYQISPMVAVDDLRFSNTPVYHYDFATGQYKITFKDNRIKDVLDKVKSMASGLFSFSSGKTGQIQMNVNKSKSTGIITRNTFVPQSFYLPGINGLNMIQDLVFLSGSIFFQCPGLTLRQPGKFIIIDRETFSDNPFDNRFLGQWLVTKVTHFFTKSMYINDVVATKLDAVSQLWSEEDKAY